MRSIRNWLLGWLIGGLLGAMVVAGYGIFRSTRNEVAELFDYELTVVAMSLPGTTGVSDLARRSTAEYKGIENDRIAIQTWDPAGRPLQQPAAEALPRQKPGLRAVMYRGVEWQVFSMQQADRFVQVAQPISVRHHLAMHFALRVLWPMLVLLPLAAFLIYFLVGKGLAPVARLSDKLTRRSASLLGPLEPDGVLPAELRPLVEALNDLLARLDRASMTQRIFVADAAHELRSPLTALKLQIQLAARDAGLAGHAAMLNRLDERLNRTIHLVRQLLTMAREDAGTGASVEPVSLRAIATEVVTDFSPLAEQKGIDLGLETPSPGRAGDAFTVLGDKHALSVLISNLVDNAIRHMRGPGRIDVILQRTAGSPELAVVDDGPGIPAAELPRVFDRFYRGHETPGPGSGLGLAIVQRIAERHGIALNLGAREDGHGLRVHVSGFTPAPAPGRGRPAKPAAQAPRRL